MRVSLGRVRLRRRPDIESRHALSLLEATLESTADGILVVSIDGKITRFNQQFIRMWRIPSEIAESGDDDRALTYAMDQLKDPEGFAKRVRELYNEPEIESFDVLHFKDGRIFERSSKPQIVDGVPVGRVWSFRDVTERNRLDDVKDTLLTAVSHELRTPLTAIVGFSSTLERWGVTMSDDEVADLYTRLSNNAKKLQRLVGDLLDFDRLARGLVEPKRERTDVGELVTSVARESEQMTGRHIRVAADDVTVSVDAAKVERIVENLVINAARHTAPDTPVWVRVRAHDEGCLIIVEDAGPGVPDELKDVIFEPFKQGPAAQPQSPGVGIGLSLVARFAALHGGRAWVEDRKGGGSSFRVFLRDENATLDLRQAELSTSTS
ncbi:MAG TPA: ATP-binding protein [Actinomycetota bacterium]|nr:ATP-binding protein [Actinomycetota bacterium]